MDTFGCSFGKASDRIVLDDSNPSLCDTDLYVYSFIIGLSLFLRSLLAMLQFRIGVHLQRRDIELRQRENPGSPGSPQRNPRAMSPGPSSGPFRFQRRRACFMGMQITTTFELVHTAIAIIFFILYGLNVIGEFNHLGIPGVMMVCFPFYVAFYLSCVKLVHLGKRVIPRNERRVIEGRGESLASVRSDTVHLILFTGLFISILNCTWTLIFAVPLDHNNQKTWIKIGFAFMAIADVFGICIVLWQTFRVTRYLEENIKAVQNYNVSSSAMKRTILKLRIRALGNLAFVVPAMVCKILLATGMRFNWYFGLTLLWTSGVCSLFATLAYLPRDFVIFPCLATNKDMPKNDRIKSSTVHAENATESRSNPTKTTNNLTNLGGNTAGVLVYQPQSQVEVAKSETHAKDPREETGDQEAQEQDLNEATFHYYKNQNMIMVFEHEDRRGST